MDRYKTWIQWNHIGLFRIHLMISYVFRPVCLLGSHWIFREWVRTIGVEIVSSDVKSLAICRVCFFAIHFAIHFFGDAIWIHLTIYRQWSLRLMMLYHMIAGVGKMEVPNGPTNKSQTFSSAHLHSCNQCAADIILLSWEGHHQQWFKLMAWAHCFCCDSDLMKENMYFVDNFPWQYSPAIRKVAKRWTTFAMVYSMNPWGYDLEVASQDNSFEHQNLMGLQWEGPYVFGHRRMKACNMK